MGDNLSMTIDKYPKIQIQLHWLMFLLVALAALSIEVREIFPKGTYLRSELKNVHIWLGEAIFAFLIVRLIVRLLSQQPSPINTLPWQVNLAKFVHWLFYLMMFVIPLSGILLLQAGGKDVSFFGYSLPEIVAPDRELKRAVKSVHEFLSNAFYFFIFFHVAAALWHQYVIKDNLLSRVKLFR